MKKYTRSKNNKILFGVCGGLSEYYQTDPLIVRLLALLLFFMSGFIPLVLVYIIAIFIVPIEGENKEKSKKRQKTFLYLAIILLTLFIVIPVLVMLIGFSAHKLNSSFDPENYSPRYNQVETEILREYGQ